MTIPVWMDRMPITADCVSAIKTEQGNGVLMRPKTKKEVLANIRRIKAENAQLVQDVGSYNDNNVHGDWIDPQYDWHERLNAELDRLIKALT